MKILKKLMGLGIVFTLSLGMAACSSSNESKDEAKDELQQIKDSGKLVLATSAEYSPYEFHKMIDGKDTIVGFDVMIAKEIADEIGVDLEFMDMDFDGLLGALNADKADIVLACMTPNEEREKSVDFSNLYYEDKNVVIVKKGDEDKIKSDEDLKNIKIGVQRGSTQEAFVVDELGCTDYKSLAKTPDLMLELQNGNIDAIVTGKNVAAINIENYDNVAIGNSNVGEDCEESAAVAFKKSDKNESLIELTNNVIKKLQDEGKIDEYMQDAIKLDDEQ
ncbi:transporter substrate-binding domain-containing protein [Romboutsia sp. Marseille-P6047]|uniref:transporter substrate-binding domain-containing protein n=1 Tax=Romboutsia sp. Marseille-P6047 TaxID=2161817 RepID=UPI000F051A2C|nr:transporter substrate-binding domain-containing protein [Romboutsia sp. Marseille-P6047]